MNSALPSISDFFLIKPISRGTFGNVFLCAKKRDPSTLYAIKIMSKGAMKKKNLANQVTTERDALAISKCSYIVHLFYSLQSDDYIYLIMEYLIGGDLKTLLMAAGYLDERHAALYTAEIAIALGYLHKHGIIHRDLKPDNILITAKGHLKLTDFGLSSLNWSRALRPADVLYTPSASHVPIAFYRTPGQIASLTTDLSFMDTPASMEKQNQHKKIEIASEDVKLAPVEACMRHQNQDEVKEVDRVRHFSSQFSPVTHPENLHRHRSLGTSKLSPLNLIALPFAVKKHASGTELQSTNPKNTTGTEEEFHTVSRCCSEECLTQHTPLTKSSSLVYKCTVNSCYPPAFDDASTSPLRRVFSAVTLTEATKTPSPVRRNRIGLDHGTPDKENKKPGVTFQLDAEPTFPRTNEKPFYSATSGPDVFKHINQLKQLTLEDFSTALCLSEINPSNPPVFTKHSPSSISPPLRTPRSLRRSLKTPMVTDGKQITASLVANNKLKDDMTSRAMLTIPEMPMSSSTMVHNRHMGQKSAALFSSNSSNLTPIRTVQKKQEEEEEDTLQTNVGGRLGDLQNSSTYQPRTPANSTRVFGTPDYLAPELLTFQVNCRAKDSPAIDWWALGVIVFEMLTGVPTFADATPEAIFNNILKLDIPWPENDPETGEKELSVNAIDLITGLLSLCPETRLLVAAEIEMHKFFAEIGSWSQLHRVVMPFVPCPDDDTDTGYFHLRNTTRSYEVTYSGCDLLNAK